MTELEFLEHYKPTPNSVSRIKNNKNIKLKISISGYVSVKTTWDNKSITFYLHRLLAILFVPNPENKPCVNHKDGNKLNNLIDNLEWVTYSENNKHAYKMGLRKPTPPMLGKFGKDHNLSKPVLQINKAGIIIKEFESCEIAAKETGINRGNIGSVARREYGFKTAGGFIWKFKSEIQEIEL